VNSLTCPACGEVITTEPALRGMDRLHGTPGDFQVAVCSSCGSGRTLPLVSTERLGELYPDDYNAYRLPTEPVPRLLATALFETRYQKALRSEPLRALCSRSPGRLLDVGSGRGDLGVVLQRRGWEVVGLEPSKEACEEANRRGIRSLRGTLTSAGETLDGPFDAVTFNHSLEHVADPLDDLVQARRLLRDGGIVTVSVPNFGSWQRRRFGTYWFHLDLPRHRSHFTPTGLERLLGRAEFPNLRVGTGTTADGLPMSIQYCALGASRLYEGAGRYAIVAVSFLVAPVSLALNHLAGGGDVVHAVAVKQRG
jgi:SAM-dependent methyltransferase